MYYLFSAHPLWKMISKAPNLVWKLRRGKNSRCALEFIFLVSQKRITYSMLRKDKSNSQVCNISNTQYWNYLGLLLISLYASTREISFFHDIWNSFVFIANCKSRRNLKPILFHIFPLFLNNGSFALYISTMFEEKV